MPQSRCVQIALNGRVALITIDYPPLNLLSRAVLAAIDAAFSESSADPHVKALVVTGAGGSAFAAGADIRELAALRTRDEALAFARFGQGVFDAIEACSKPVVAAVNGAAFGGGLELALACHLRVFSESARVGQTECRLGIMPGWGATQRLPRLIGLANASQMILSGDIIDAQEAFRLGLAQKLAPPEGVLPAAVGLAERMVAHGRLSTQASLRAIRYALDVPIADGLAFEAEQFASLLVSHDAGEGLSAFLQKRSPEFTDS